MSIHEMKERRRFESMLEKLAIGTLTAAAPISA